MPQPTIKVRKAAAADLLKQISREAGTKIPEIAKAYLMPAAFAVVDAVAWDNPSRARGMAEQLWKVVSKPGAFSTGESWADEPVYLDGDPCTRRSVALWLAADGLAPAGISLFLGTAQPAPWIELAASYAFDSVGKADFKFDPDQPRDHGRWTNAGGDDGTALPKSPREKQSVLNEQAHPKTWAAKQGAKTVGEARQKIEALPTGTRVQHPSGAVGDITKVRGKTAVKFPDQTVSLDQMGRDAQHLSPSAYDPHHTPNPPPGWRVGDNLPVPKGTYMDKSKTVGDARKRLHQLSEGTQIVTPDGRLGEIVNVSPPGRSVVNKGPRNYIPGVKVLGRDPVPLSSFPPASIPHFRIITRDPYKQKLAPGSPARKSLGVSTAGAALGKLASLPVGDRVLDHRTGKLGTLVQVVAGGNKSIKMMRPGIKFDGEAARVLDGFTGDLVKHLEWIKPGTAQSGTASDDKPREPKAGFISRLLAGVGKAVGAVVKGLDDEPAPKNPNEKLAVENYNAEKSRPKVRRKPKNAT